MKIEISKGEYKTLLQIFELADWVLTAHKTEEDKRHKLFHKLEQKLFSLADGMGYGSLIEYSKELREYFPTRKYEDTCSVMEFIEEFEDDSFWDELIDRLAMRDTIREVGEVEFKALEISERITLVESHKDIYWDEFEAHGLSRMYIAKGDQEVN